MTLKGMIDTAAKMPATIDRMALQSEAHRRASILQTSLTILTAAGEVLRRDFGFTDEQLGAFVEATVADARGLIND